MLGALEPDMLVMADRNLYSFELWTQARTPGLTCCGGVVNLFGSLSCRMGIVNLVRPSVAGTIGVLIADRGATAQRVSAFSTSFGDRRNT